MKVAVHCRLRGAGLIVLNLSHRRLRRLVGASVGVGSRSALCHVSGNPATAVPMRGTEKRCLAPSRRAVLILTTNVTFVKRLPIGRGTSDARAG